MAFISDLALKYKFKPDYTVVNFGGRVAYIENITTVKEITPSLIVLAIKSVTLTIEGENLLVEEIDEGSITVKGEIRCVQEKA